MSKEKSSTPRKRRPNGSGTIIHDKKRKIWIVRFCYIARDGVRRKKSKSFHARKEAKAYMVRTATARQRALAIANMQHEVVTAAKDAEKLVYFIQPVGGGPIKIGTTANIGRRLAIIQANNPYPLQLLHLCPGDHAVEAEFHRRFKDYRLHGEWFVGDEEVIDFIGHLKQESREFLSTGG